MYHQLLNPLAQQPPVGQGLLVMEASQSHSDTPLSVGLLWTSDQPNAEASAWQHTTPKTNVHALSGFQTHSPSKLAVADPRLNPRCCCGSNVRWASTIWYRVAKVTPAISSLPQHKKPVTSRLTTGVNTAAEPSSKRVSRATSIDIYNYMQSIVHEIN
jgi:hypothetical protein